MQPLKFKGKEFLCFLTLAALFPTWHTFFVLRQLWRYLSGNKNLNSNRTLCGCLPLQAIKPWIFVWILGLRSFSAIFSDKNKLNYLPHIPDPSRLRQPNQCRALLARKAISSSMSIMLPLTTCAWKSRIEEKTTWIWAKNCICVLMVFCSWLFIYVYDSGLVCVCERV